MTDVIDASRRFRSNRYRGDPPTPISILRQTKRVDLADRVLLAERLGTIAADLCPERPKQAAKRWFDIWNGDRWGKRKRLICLPGESIDNPSDEGSVVASGADWAALIERVVQDLAPDGPSAANDRQRIERDILRGTRFLPAFDVTPLRAESAQSLMSALCDAITYRIENDTDLRRLWEVLETTPFEIESYESGLLAKGDTYSSGPFGEPSKLAAEPSKFRYRPTEDGGYRFGFSKSGRSIEWQYPIIKLGMLGHTRKTRMFVLPRDFVRDLPQEREEELAEFEVTPEQCAFEWMLLKGFRTENSNGLFSEVAFDSAKNYGWRNFEYEIAQSVWIEVRPKSDGTPGVWINISESEPETYLPRVSGQDILATFANSRHVQDNFYTFWPDSVDRTCEVEYGFLNWPEHNQLFAPNGQLPHGATSGWLETNWEYLEGLEGWLDDITNHELQNVLFRNEAGVRFCPAISVPKDISPPCQAGTAAAAIILNAGCGDEHRIGVRLVDQSQTLATCGLAFHDALMGHHSLVIASMFEV